jgi:hypothetical protein
MHTCNNCLKGYTTKEHYLSHIERCNKKNNIDDDTRSLITSYSNISRRGSDIESKSKMDTLQHIEKLTKDKIKLKSDIKKVVDECYKLKDEYGSENVRIKENYNKQIYTLTKERDKYAEDIILTRKDMKDINSKKEKMKEEYNINLRKYKNITTQVKEKEEHEQVLVHEVNKAREANKILQKNIENEKNKLTSLKSTYTLEKEAYKIKYEQDQKKEIQAMINDKQKTINIFTGIKGTLENKLITLKKEYDIELNKLKKTHQNKISSHESIMNEMLAQYKTKLEEQKRNFESQIDVTNKQVSKTIQTERNEWLKKISENKSQYENVLHVEKLNGKRHINELQEQLEKSKEETKTQKRIVLEYATRDKEDIKTVNEDIKNDVKEKEKLLEEIISYKNIIVAMKEDAHKVNIQYIDNLNNQKLNNDKLENKIIYERQEIEKEFKNKNKNIIIELDKYKVLEQHTRKEINKLQAEIKLLKDGPPITSENDKQIISLREELSAVRLDFISKTNLYMKEYEENINNFKIETKKNNEEIQHLNSMIHKNLEQYTSQLNSQGHSKYKIRTEELEKELEKQENIMKMKDGAIIQLSDDIDKMNNSPNLNIHSINNYENKLEELKKTHTNNNDINEKISKMKEDYLETLVKLKMELTQCKELMQEYKEKLGIVEALLIEKEIIIGTTLKGHEELKNSFVHNLNQQKMDKESVIMEKNKIIDKYEKRIEDLETILNNNLKKM